MWRKWRNRMVLSAAGRAFKEAVRLRVLERMYDGLTPTGSHNCCYPSGNLVVTFRWYRSSKRGDLDNRAKCLLDALQGTVYRNDNQITELHAYRIDTAEDAGKGRIVVEIVPLNGKRFA